MTRLKKPVVALLAGLALTALSEQSANAGRTARVIRPQHTARRPAVRRPAVRRDNRRYRIVLTSRGIYTNVLMTFHESNLWRANSQLGYWQGWFNHRGWPARVWVHKHYRRAWPNRVEVVYQVRSRHRKRYVRIVTGWNTVLAYQRKFGGAYGIAASRI